MITELYEKSGMRIVVLIDEYDHAIISRLSNLKIAEGNREILKGFFTILKSMSKQLQFTFITGVSKFSQGSLFSGPNNLTDITMDLKYAGIMGYTGEEIEEYFQDYIQAIVENEYEDLTTEKSVIEENSNLVQRL